MLKNHKHISSTFILIASACIYGLLACSTTEQTISSNSQDNVDSLATAEEDIASDKPDEVFESKKDSLIQVMKQELYNQYQTDANRLSSFYILAQQRFFAGEHEEALFLINEAARIKTTADILALKGSIYLGLGSVDEFGKHWREALTLDENVPIPPSPAVVRELKRQGLINENLERNF